MVHVRYNLCSLSTVQQHFFHIQRLAIAGSPHVRSAHAHVCCMHAGIRSHMCNYPGPCICPSLCICACMYVCMSRFTCSCPHVRACTGSCAARQSRSASYELLWEQAGPPNSGLDDRKSRGIPGSHVGASTNSGPLCRYRACYCRGLSLVPLNR